MLLLWDGRRFLLRSTFTNNFLLVATSSCSYRTVLGNLFRPRYRVLGVLLVSPSLPCALYIRTSVLYTHLIYMPSVTTMARRFFYVLLYFICVRKYSELGIYGSFGRSSATKAENHYETEFDERPPNSFVDANYDTLRVRLDGFNTITHYDKYGNYKGTDRINNWELFALRYATYTGEINLSR